MYDDSALGWSMASQVANFSFISGNVGVGVGVGVGASALQAGSKLSTKTKAATNISHVLLYILSSFLFDLLFAIFNI